jgi:hypothetical protein
VQSTYAALPLGSNPSGGAQMLVVSLLDSGNFTHSVGVFDMTTTPPVFSGTTLIEADVGGVKILGPDNCLYLANGNVVYKLSNADGSCPLAGLAPDPSVVLTSETLPATAAQGASLRFDVNFPHASLPLGTPVTYLVSGANSLQRVAYVGYGGSATFTYSGESSGSDTLVAYAQINGATVASNSVSVTWTPGQHTTFLNLNSSVTSASLGSSTTVSATLTDVSATPAVPVVDASIQFMLAGQSCTATTNASGSASCSIAVSALSQCTLTASYAGSTQYLPITASELFSVSSYDIIFTNGFEAPLQGGGCVLY